MGKRRSLQGGVLQMEKVRHVLRLCELGFNQRAIARATGVARSSLQEYLRTAEVEGITYEHAALMTDAELREAFKKQRPGRSRIEVTEPNFEQLHKSMMSRKGVTLELHEIFGLDPLPAQGGQDANSFAPSSTSYKPS